MLLFCTKFARRTLLSHTLPLIAVIHVLSESFYLWYNIFNLFRFFLWNSHQLLSQSFLLMQHLHGNRAIIKDLDCVLRLPFGKNPAQNGFLRSRVFQIGVLLRDLVLANVLNGRAANRLATNLIHNILTRVPIPLSLVELVFTFAQVQL